jgi:hypothetical protein
MFFAKGYWGCWRRLNLFLEYLYRNTGMSQAVQKTTAEQIESRYVEWGFRRA